MMIGNTMLLPTIKLPPTRTTRVSSFGLHWCVPLTIGKTRVKSTRRGNISGIPENEPGGHEEPGFGALDNYEYGSHQGQTNKGWYERAVKILEWKQLKISGRVIKYVIVLWRHQNMEKITLEWEDDMRAHHPHLF
ncbi:hypothetical protein Vadar_028758 [Vaccinium darrowii]|uniref:Uncharacterized protein n=1 Tax=Vaccinium darrowii TaxID=229202 RepID=A0ACB7ZM86_9ERIC|nr:hypothetical protein Vadar_028758 [Vaccinium darrowii]